MLSGKQRINPQLRNDNKALRLDVKLPNKRVLLNGSVTCSAPLHIPMDDLFNSPNSAMRKKLKGSSTTLCLIELPIGGKVPFTGSEWQYNLFSTEKQASNRFSKQKRGEL